MSDLLNEPIFAEINRAAFVGQKVSPAGIVTRWERGQVTVTTPPQHGDIKEEPEVTGPIDDRLEAGTGDGVRGSLVTRELNWRSPEIRMESAMRVWTWWTKPASNQWQFEVCLPTQSPYPVSQVLRLYTNKNKETPLVLDFIRFVQSPRGQKVLSEMGFVPRL